MVDAVVIGSGPNGLAAAVELARNGAAVTVLEDKETIGGGARTAELTLPGFRHDVCSAAHPLGIESPYFSTLPLREHGLEWVLPSVSVAHPLDGEPAVLLSRGVDDTASQLDADAPAYRRLMSPLADRGRQLLAEVLAPPVHVPRHPVTLARFGAPGLLSATALGRLIFRGERARALLAGCAAHSILPLERPPSGAVGLMFLLTGHMHEWPVARGGSQAIANSLASLLATLGGRVHTRHKVASLTDLPPARAYLFDTSPAQLASIAGPQLPRRYVRSLRRYHYGPGVFKIDWALDGPIPWSDPRCRDASTVHLGGSMQEIAAAESDVWRGNHPESPYVLLVQPSLFDDSRAPAGRHTGWAYCHVPSGSTLDRTDVIERQVERFAPGFRDRILARHVMDTAAIERNNANDVGGAITGGAASLWQLVARPVPRIDPYATPNPRFYICSAATPPGGGVHGMCGFHAAQSALRRMHDLPLRDAK
ncbi:MAG: NAD(P)/FAD-dependent oxidoreductase [Candidatus Dormibacteraeota bacterium]|nr:NAD(P)/FAD-dependent oxidoreductase [Candidatus Dormibacteraeota bacterium]